MTTKSADPRSPPGMAVFPTPKNNLSGAGSTQANATVIPLGQDLSIFTTVAASQGAVLPVAGVSIGEEYEVANHGANALSLYPGLGGQIGTLGANAAVSVAAGKTCTVIYVGQNAWCYNNSG